MQIPQGEEADGLGTEPLEGANEFVSHNSICSDTYSCNCSWACRIFFRGDLQSLHSLETRGAFVEPSENITWPLFMTSECIILKHSEYLMYTKTYMYMLR